MIGVNAAGDSAAGNGWDGIIVTGYDNQIGQAGAGNIISGNGRYGINIYNSSGNIVMGNIIGADAGGTTAIPNGSAGIFTQGETTNRRPRLGRGQPHRQQWGRWDPAVRYGTSLPHRREHDPGEHPLRHPRRFHGLRQRYLHAEQHLRQR